MSNLRSVRRSRDDDRVDEAWSRRLGFTLVETVVVLVLLALGTALVAPSLLTPGNDQGRPLVGLIAVARDAAIRRAETLRLEVDVSGQWRLTPETPAPDAGAAPLMEGRLEPGSAPLVLRFSPLGSCAPDAVSFHAAAAPAAL